MIKNNLYKIEKQHFLIYETEEMAKIMLLEANKPQSQPVISVCAGVEILITNSAHFWSNKFNTLVFSSKPEDVICVFEEKTSNPGYRFWYCLIGEKTGWIIVPDWAKVVSIND
jgi:hypothetical protein